MSFAKDVLICTLLYGDHFDLHKRILDSFVKCVPAETTVWIWMNSCGKQTQDYAKLLQPNRKWILSFAGTNEPKYKVMRDMFLLFKEAEGSDHKWVVWFDDDSWITKDDWFAHMEAYIKAKQRENICYIGQPWFVHHLPGQWDFISKSKWFKDRLTEKICDKPGVNFAQGAYWWLRTDVACRLDWPDERLSHNGGDTLLGEAIRQQGLPFHKHDYGVKVNDAKRRGRSDRPAGSDVEMRR